MAAEDRDPVSGIAGSIPVTTRAGTCPLAGKRKTGEHAGEAQPHARERILKRIWYLLRAALKAQPDYQVARDNIRKSLGMKDADAAEPQKVL